MNQLRINDPETVPESEETKKSGLFSMEQGKDMHYYFMSYRYYEKFCAMATLLSIIGFVVDYEISYNKNSLKGECELNESKSEDLRILIIFFSISAVYFETCRYLTESKWLDLALNLEPNKPLKYVHYKFKFWRRVKFACKVLILLIMPLPYYDYDLRIPQRFSNENITLCYRLNTLIFCFGICRIYFLLRVFVNYSCFYNEQSLIFCINKNVNIGIGFAVKCLIYTNPYRTILLMGLMAITIGTILARILERPMDSRDDLFYDYIVNYFWFIFETVSTLGYGDYTCITYGCRIITVFTWFFGSILIGLLIVALQQSIDMNKDETKAFSMINNCINSAKLLKMWVRVIEAKKKKVSRAKFLTVKNKFDNAVEESKLARLFAQENCRKKNNELNKEILTMKYSLLSCSKKLDDLIKLYE